LNPTFDYGIHDEGPPVVIDATNGLSFTPGSALTVSYLSGLVQAGVGYPHVDANGEPGNVVNFAEGRPARFPAFYMNPGPDVMSMELVGTFANNGVIVGQPFPIGNVPLHSPYQREQINCCSALMTLLPRQQRVPHCASYWNSYQHIAERKLPGTYHSIS
jgi:hypothetical protein